MTDKKLFRIPESDPFVKFACADLVRILSEELETINYTDYKVTVSEDELLDSLNIMHDVIFDKATSRTHRLSRTAKSVNERLDEEDREPLFNSPSTYFPSADESSTQFEDNRISPGDVSEVTVLDAESAGFEDERSVYRLRESYLGNTGQTGFEGALDRSEQCYDVYTNVIREELDGDNVCSCCGRSDMITSSIDQKLGENMHYETEKDEQKAIDSGSKDAYRVEFGQSMTPYMTKSGRTRPAGSGSGDSYIQGRCPSCVFLGFYYTLMKKPIDVISFTDSLFRTLCPTGKFTSLVDVSGILNTELIGLTEGQEVRTRTLELIRTESDSAMSLHFFEMIRNGFQKVESLGSTTMLPVGVLSVDTTTDKSNQGVRGFKSFDEVGSGSRIIRLVEPMEVTKSDIVEKIDPISQLVIPFINVYSNSSDTEPAVDFKDLFCEGIIIDDLGKVERGVFNIFKAYRSESLSGNLYSPTNLIRYVDKVMSTHKNIGDDELEAIRNVGSALGQEFHDNMNVMISLQNASSQAQFLQAFEKAGMQAFKKGRGNAAESGYTPHTNDIEKVVKVLTDEETFEAAKQLLVIHASFSGHYENIQQNRSD